MDNLIASKKAKPMLVVMTNGNANQKMGPRYDVVPGQTIGNTGNPGEVGVVGVFAGLPMGGGHPIAATNAHAETFSYVGVFSMGTAADISDKLEALKKGGVKFYYVGHGKDDPFVKVAQGQNLAAQLEKAGINHHYTESSGGHTWSNWRLRCFRNKPVDGSIRLRKQTAATPLV